MAQLTRLTCRNCSTPFQRQHKVGPIPRFCPSCRKERLNARKRLRYKTDPKFRKASRAKAMAWAAANPEKKKEVNADWYIKTRQNNSEWKKENSRRAKAWRRKNAAHVREYKAAYRSHSTPQQPEPKP